MKIVNGAVRLAATDFSNHLSCGHLTGLNLAEARGERKAPPVRAPDLVVLQQRGLDHEKAYIETLRASGFSIKDLSGIYAEDYAVGETLAAMASGVNIIVQGALKSGNWFGRPDVLRKVETPGASNEWTYEPYDCKLARETKATTILQLSHYAALIELINGHQPENMYVVPPSSDFRAEAYRVLDYAAYYRAVRRRLGEAVAGNGETYPEPTEHCDVCRWWQDCDRQWRRDDHLSLTAGISRWQRKQLVEWRFRLWRRFPA